MTTTRHKLCAWRSHLLVERFTSGRQAGSSIQLHRVNCKQLISLNTTSRKVTYQGQEITADKHNLSAVGYIVSTTSSCSLYFSVKLQKNSAKQIIINKPVGDMVCSLVWDCAHMSNAHLLKLTTSSVKLTGKLVGNITRLVSTLYRPILTSIAGEAF